MTEPSTSDAIVDEHTGLWRGDAGELPDRTRRVLLRLVRGPYLSGAREAQLWAVLLTDEAAIHSRLADLFLELVIDRDNEFAFVRNAPSDDAPKAVRSEALTFLDTAMLLVLRQFLLTAPGEERVIVGQDEVYEQLSVYRDGDESTFQRNLNGSWGRMVNKLRVLHSAGEERFQISPMVRFLIDEDRVRELTAVYRRIAGGGDAGGDEGDGAGRGLGDGGEQGDGEEHA